MIIVVLFFIILITYTYYCDNIEPFTSANIYSSLPDSDETGRSGQINWSPIISAGKHVKFDKFEEIEDITSFPPKPELGDRTCFKFDCPENIIDNAVCWKCE